MPKTESDYWMPENVTFVHYNKGYQVNKSMQTVCIGEIRVTGRNSYSVITSPSKEQPVTKIAPNSKPPPPSKTKGIMLQEKRGRPVKDGEVTRMTLWRRKRKKELNKI